MAELKTRENDGDVVAFLSDVANERRRTDALALLEIVREVTGWEPVMWGTSIVGFGRYHYRYESGREGDWPIVGFSPRKSSLVLYIMSGFAEYDELLGRLGKHKTGKSCLYVNKLADVDLDVLRELIERSVRYMVETYETS